MSTWRLRRRHCHSDGRYWHIELSNGCVGHSKATVNAETCLSEEEVSVSQSDLVVLVIGGLMLVHLAIGLPLFIVLGAGSLAIVSFLHIYSPSALGEVPFTAIDNWALLAMPLFILTGDIISTGRIARQLVRLGQAGVGWITGGLGMATIMGCFFFAGTSGSNSADTAAIGKIMIPSMVTNGYQKPYAAALAAAGGCLGIIVPPSLIFIIYGVITSTSVGDLFLGGVLP